MKEMKVFEKNYEEVLNENYCSLDFDIQNLLIKLT